MSRGNTRRVMMPMTRCAFHATVACSAIGNETTNWMNRRRSRP
jgi:hypothetical protein